MEREPNITDSNQVTQKRGNSAAAPAEPAKKQKKSKVTEVPLNELRETFVTSQVLQLPLSKISPIPESLRARRIADARVQHWKSLFSSGLATAGDKSTFVVIERADGDGQYYTIDGNHRLSALLELKDNTITTWPCRIVRGRISDAGDYFPDAGCDSTLSKEDLIRLGELENTLSATSDASTELRDLLRLAEVYHSNPHLHKKSVKDLEDYFLTNYRVRYLINLVKNGPDTADGSAKAGSKSLLYAAASIFKSAHMRPMDGVLYHILADHEDKCGTKGCAVTASTLTADQCGAWKELLQLPKEDLEPLVSAYVAHLCPSSLKNKARRRAALEQLVQVPEIIRKVQAAKVLREIEEIAAFKTRLIYNWACKRVTDANAKVLQGSDEDLLKRLKHLALLDIAKDVPQAKHATVEKQSDAKGNEQPEAVDQLKKALTVSRACERMVLLDAQKIRDGALPKHTISDVWCELPATPAATQILEELCMALIPTDIVAPQAIVFIQCASLDPLLTAHNILGKYGFQHVPIPLVVNLDSSAISSAPLGLPQDGCHQIWMFTRSAKRVKFSGVFKKQTNCFLAIASNLVAGVAAIPAETITAIVQSVQLELDPMQQTKERHALLWRPQSPAELLFGFGTACCAKDAANSAASFEPIFEKVSVVSTEAQYPEVMAQYVKFITTQPPHIIQAVCRDQTPIGRQLHNEAVKAAAKAALAKKERKKSAPVGPATSAAAHAADKPEFAIASQAPGIASAATLE